jgi:hypothetical protein
MKALIAATLIVATFGGWCATAHAMSPQCQQAIASFNARCGGAMQPGSAQAAACAAERARLQATCR